MNETPFQDFFKILDVSIAATLFVFMFTQIYRAKCFQSILYVTKQLNNEERTAVPPKATTVAGIWRLITK